MFSLSKAGGPYIGKRGGKWADPQHKIAWKDHHAAQAKTPQDKLPSDVIGVLVDHVEQSDSLSEAISDFEDAGDRSLFLPGGKVKASALAAELRSWKPVLPPAGAKMITVEHSTDRETAKRILRDGVIPQMKPWTLASRRHAAGEAAEFSPGAGVERGLYVGSKGTTSGFGAVTLHLQVPADWLHIPAEVSALGHTTAGDALDREHGMLVRRPIHPSMISMAKSRTFNIGIPLTIRTAVMGPPPSPNREEYPYVGTINFQGILLYIENAPGSVRSGTDRNGQPWSMRMKQHYGEIPGTSGSDGDPIDVYVGENPSSNAAFIIHQRNFFGDEHSLAGVYDEDKVMLGFSTEQEALHAYASHFNHSVWMPGCTRMTVDELRQRLDDGELSYGAALVKAKYIRRWKGKDGKWLYEYPELHAGVRKKPPGPPGPRGPSGPKKAPPGSQLHPEELAQLRALGITKLPEGSIPLSEITVNLSSRGIHTRAVIKWRDKKGRGQSAYTPTFHAENAKKKWQRVLKFRDGQPAMERGFVRQLGRTEPGSLEHQANLVSAIISKTGLRPGSEQSLADTGNFGVTTMNADHVTVSGNTVSIAYVGKSGKPNTARIRNKAIAQALSHYKEKGGRMFSKRVIHAAREALPGDMKLKDFRTILATNTAMEALDDVIQPPPLTGDRRKDKRLLTRAMNQASKLVAAKLNNTASVARESYIHPEVFKAWARDRAGAPDDLWEKP